VLEGRVVNYRAPMTAVVERTYLHYVKKFERYERRRTKIHAHVPPCIELRPGDAVTIAECRPLAKTVSHVVVERREVKGSVGT
jgi:small subunit ribosomal protein S17